MKLVRGDMCPKTGEGANPLKCSDGGSSICSYLDGVKARELVTMTVVDSISCNHPEARESAGLKPLTKRDRECIEKLGLTQKVLEWIGSN